MLKKIINKVRSLFKKTKEVDPSSFNDPVAKITDWSPAKGGGSNFRTHRIVTVSPDRVEFKISVGGFLFCFAFIAIGVGAPVGILLSAETSNARIFGISFGAIFATVGLVMLYCFASPRVFDKSKGYYWKGRKSPDNYDLSSIKEYTELSRIHALQIISEHCSGNDSSYYSYELNLVLKDGARINVIDHGSRKKLCQDAEVLADFLNVPIWDAT